MISRSQLKFHETFQPELNYISKILCLAAERYKGSKFNISDCTGIPTGKQKGKVEPNIKYAYYMGLIDYFVDKGEYSLSLTPLGEEVFVQDKYLHESLTHWICHYGITRYLEGAPQWSFLVHSAHSGFMSGVSSEYLLAQANKAFGVEMAFEELFGVVKRSYLDGCFRAINYLTWDDNVLFHERPENQELIFAYAYAIINSWKRLIPEKDEITINELQDKIGFGKTFGFNDNETNYVLDILSSEGVLSLNRQLFPATLICTANTNDVISLLYSRLL